MQVDIRASPAFAFADITIAPGGYAVHKAGSWKTTTLGGEGLVSRFTGPGRLWLQTRSPQHFLDWLNPKLPTKRS